MTVDTRFDWHRSSRCLVPEAVYAEGKSPEQISDILTEASERSANLLVTRLDAETHGLVRAMGHVLEYSPVARAGVFGAFPEFDPRLSPIGLVAAGTSDLPVIEEAAVTARFLGMKTEQYLDVGVAGLWRIQSVAEEIARLPIVIACAGMEAALFSVLAGLVPCPIIAVPTSTGYGVSANGDLALKSALGTRAPGVVTMNIDNGFGAAAAAYKFLHINLAR